jgi:hypothetical protein
MAGANEKKAECQQRVKEAGYRITIRPRDIVAFIRFGLLRRTVPLREDDSFWGIIGIGGDAAPPNLSRTLDTPASETDPEHVR